MSGTKKSSSPGNQRPRRPAISPDAREGQMISLAVDLAEQQLRDGTASSQVITHFLKLATKRERIEREILEKQKDLIVAKTEQIHDQKRTDEMFREAIDAIRGYQGRNDPNEN